MNQTKVSDKVSQEAQNISSNAQDWADKAKSTAQAVSGTAQQWARKAQGTARDAGAAADLYVHEYAWTTMVLVGVVAGLIGFMLGRREA